MPAKQLTILVTGPTNGIGRETALGLAALGHRLVLLCRNREAGQKLVNQISLMPQAAEPMLLVADLNNFEQVRAAAVEFLATGKPLDVLINNAGIINVERRVTDGIEEMFRVNHLGHFLLTNLLLDKIIASRGRVISVASDAHSFCDHIHYDDLSFADNYKTFEAYGHSKLANMLMIRELAKRLEKLQPEADGARAYCLHPGMVASQLGYQNKRWYTSIVLFLMKLISITPKQGADTSIYLATTDDPLVNGGYYYQRKTRASKRWARSESDAERLWEVSERLVNLS